MTRFFVDSNVLLRVGQPDAGFLHESSLHFLEAHPGELYVGLVVYREVQYQITRFSGRYARIPAIKHWLYVGCTKLPDQEKVRQSKSCNWRTLLAVGETSRVTPETASMPRRPVSLRYRTSPPGMPDFWVSRIA
jgi:predicted nucleic acid-binding protein